MWGTGTEDDARIYDNLGEDSNNPLLTAGADTVGISSFLLADNRDSKNYTIRRLADGKCWMTTNLRTDIDTATFTKDNTNNPADYFVTNANTDNIISVVGDSKYNEGYEESIVWTKVGYNPEINGNQYNWFAATAGNYHTNMIKNITAGDICPFGWHVPTGGSTGNYASLSVALGGLDLYMDQNTIPTGQEILTKFMAFPNNFTLSGEGGNAYAATGRYWSSTSATVYSRPTPLYLRFGIEPSNSNAYLSPGDGAAYTANTFGFPVRCVARD